MNLYLVVCRECGKEILDIENIRRTPSGRVVCSDCTSEEYTDMPMN